MTPFIIGDPTMHAFDACLNAHSWLENILLADLRARLGLSDYTDDYYDRFYNQVGATLIRQLTDASTDVGSYWLTAWINAGRPACPSNSTVPPPYRPDQPILSRRNSAPCPKPNCTCTWKEASRRRLSWPWPPVTATRHRSQVAARYAHPDFAAFIEAYKWVTSYLREPQDYALIAQGLADQLLAQNVVYAEVTLSVGVMILRRQDVEANFLAIREAAAAVRAAACACNGFSTPCASSARPAMEVARCAVELRGEGVIAYGLGGDDSSSQRASFASLRICRRATACIAWRMPAKLAVRNRCAKPSNCWAPSASATASPLHWTPPLDLLAERAIPLEICPTSNLRTGALARQLGNPRRSRRYRDHPLPLLLRCWRRSQSLHRRSRHVRDEPQSRIRTCSRKWGSRTAEISAWPKPVFSRFLPARRKTAHAAPSAPAAVLGLL